MSLVNVGADGTKKQVTVEDFVSAQKLLQKANRKIQNMVFPMGARNQFLLVFLNKIERVKIEFKCWLYLPERLKHIIYVSVNSKHGLYKVKINVLSEEFKIFKGTKFIYSYPDFDGMITFFTIPNINQKP